jgi:hypothetical protein
MLLSLLGSLPAAGMAEAQAVSPKVTFDDPVEAMAKEKGIRRFLQTTNWSQSNLSD